MPQCLKYSVEALAGELPQYDKMSSRDYPAESRNSKLAPLGHRGVEASHSESSGVDDSGGCAIEIPE